MDFWGVYWFLVAVVGFSHASWDDRCLPFMVW